MPVVANFAPIVARAETEALTGDAARTLTVLRDLPLADFMTILFTLPDPSLPGISAVLPRMASEEVQRAWHGSAGEANLRGTVEFGSLLAYLFAKLQRQPLDGKRLLDFGCGYGRNTRLFSYFSNPDAIFACDPWDEALRLCREAGLLGTIAQSDYLPQTLPFGDTLFDLIIAWSVFTHTSERATRAALGALRRSIAPDGLAMITVRPEDYWPVHFPNDPERARALTESHRESGFAFSPHNRAPVDGDITYGDCSMSFTWLAANSPEWSVTHIDRCYRDRTQLLVFMRPV